LQRTRSEHGFIRIALVNMNIPWFRELYEGLLTYEGDRPYRDVLLPWQNKADQAMSVLNNYGDRQTRPLLQEDNIYIWNLYALSRVSDLLLLPFQKDVGDNGSWRGPNIGPEERDAYLVSLGMRPIEQKTFHPFFHEIVEVVESPDPAEQISIDTVLWSGFMLRDLLFCRAGVRVRGGSDYIKKDVAEISTLYFTFRRKNRPVSDLSHGWGSNSQWRTGFRRDYEDSTTLYYNVDGELDVTKPHPDDPHSSSRDSLTTEARVELLVNRCFIHTEGPHQDLWPFYDTYSEKK
jgi:hypothetical protein